MAKKTPKTAPPETTVTMIAGKNKPVNNVVKIEDLMQNLKQHAAAPTQKSGAAREEPPGQLTSIAELAAELEKRLRAARRAEPPKSPPKNAKRKA